MSDSRSPASADDPEDSPPPENGPAASKAPTSRLEAEKNSAPDDPVSVDSQVTDAKPDAADEAAAAAPDEQNATPAKSPVDLEGVRAATMISISGGPKSSQLKWGLINLFIRLFKLTARFFPILLLLGGLGYTYTYFFGSIPLMDKVLTNPVVERITSHPTIDSMLNKVGIDLPTKEERAEAAQAAEARGEASEPQSRVGQMLQQTRDVVAASDARVNMGNALAEGDFSAAEEMLNEPGTGAEGAEGQTAAKASVPGDSSGSLAENAAAQEAAFLAREPDSFSTYAGSNTAWTDIRDKVDADVDENPFTAAPEPLAPSAASEVDYTSDVEPSPAFRAWLRTIRVGGVMAGADPKALINRMTFRPGEMVDYNLRITFEGFAEQDTLIVFKDSTGAYLTVAK